MPLLKRVGPITVEVAPGTPAQGDRPAVSPVYRNVDAAEEMPTTHNGCCTLYEVWTASVERHSNNKCLGRRPRPRLADGTAGPYEFLTYKETHARALHLASALAAAGLVPGGAGKLGVFSPNTLEWMLAARAADALAAAVIPLYDSLGEDAVEHIVHHSGLTVALVDASKLAAFAALAPKVSKQVGTVVVTGDAPPAAALAALRAAGMEVHEWAAFLERGAAAPVEPSPPAPSDVACIMYTSGTTGTPKGVVLTHRTLTAAVSGANRTLVQAQLALSPGDSMLSFLPLAHVYGRLMEEMVLSIGGSIGYWRGDAKTLMDDAAALRPTLFMAVPRILERVADGVRAKLAKGPAAARAAFHAAFAYKLFLLRRGLPYWASGLGVDQLVFRRIRDALGGRVRFIVSGGAPLAPHVEDFCAACLAPVLQGYGLTETCGGAFITQPDPRLAHTCGPPLTTIEFRLESVKELNYDAAGRPPRGEVQLRGPMLFSGYYKDEAKTAAEFTDDGWFRSGDVGEITPHGCLRIIDRKKNIFKLAQGEYIAVEFLESKYVRSDAVEQVWLYGSPLESSLVAVVVPVAGWLDKHGGEAASPEARAAMVEELGRTGKTARLRGFELVRAVRLEPRAFSVEDDLMTPSLKLKRPQLQKRYQAEIDEMYKELKARRA